MRFDNQSVPRVVAPASAPDMVEPGRRGYAACRHASVKYVFG
jgi:hypothetical protein